MRVAIIGSREIGSFSVNDMISHIPVNTVELVSGGAIGIDYLAEVAAKKLSVPIKIFAPDYDKFGRTAPLVRNRQIVDYSDIVIAFWDNHSHGTAYTLNYCIQTHTPFRIFPLSLINDID